MSTSSCNFDQRVRPEDLLPSLIAAQSVMWHWKPESFSKSCCILSTCGKARAQRPSRAIAAPHA